MSVLNDAALINHLIKIKGLLYHGLSNTQAAVLITQTCQSNLNSHSLLHHRRQINILQLFHQPSEHSHSKREDAVLGK